MTKRLHTDDRSSNATFPGALARTFRRCRGLHACVVIASLPNNFAEDNLNGERTQVSRPRNLLSSLTGATLLSRWLAALQLEQAVRRVVRPVIQGVPGVAPPPLSCST
jgi:hypothetical protein